MKMEVVPAADLRRGSAMSVWPLDVLGGEVSEFIKKDRTTSKLRKLDERVLIQVAEIINGQESLGLHGDVDADGFRLGSPREPEHSRLVGAPQLLGSAGKMDLNFGTGNRSLGIGGYNADDVGASGIVGLCVRERCERRVCSGDDTNRVRAWSNHHDDQRKDEYRTGTGKIKFGIAHGVMRRSTAQTLLSSARNTSSRPWLR